MSRTRQTARPSRLTRDASAVVGLDSPLATLKGIGPVRAASLIRAGMTTVADLIRHLPRRHLERLTPTPIAALPDEGAAAVAATVKSARASRRGRGGMTRVVLDDGAAKLEVLFFNQPHLTTAFPRGASVFVQGRVAVRDGVRRLAASYWERLDPQPDVTDGADSPDVRTKAVRIPVYELPDGVPPRLVRRLLTELLPRVLPDVLDWRAGGGLPALELPALGAAIGELHFPTELARLAAARRRLAYEELFARLLPLERRRALQETRVKPRKIAADPTTVARLAANLPFTMTSAQRRTLGEITADLARPAPMHRLLHGEVGSGKTAVALLALALVAEHGLTGALLAPTEILARQHEAAARRLLAPIASGIRIERLTGATTAVERREIASRLAAGGGRIVIGTHALLGERVLLPNLALAVIDEQHRFGVSQRARLRDKGDAVDLLVMTATPIPRTLALTLYGDLDLSVLDELPAGRTVVRTERAGRNELARVVDEAAAEARTGGRVYVVCPLVESSAEDDREAAVTFAKKLELRFRGKPGPAVALAHGRKSPAENARALEDFKSGVAPILVATVIVEVGVDVPEATAMVVLDADRFGLAQLHQLRGRVGRGARPGRCVLVASSDDVAIGAKLDVLVRERNGFKIAEEDLRLRGAGEAFGTRQHGALDFVHADLIRDVDLLARAREDARSIVRSGRGAEIAARLPRFGPAAAAGERPRETEAGPG